MHAGSDPLALVGRSIEGKYDVAAFVERQGVRATYRAMHRLWAEPVMLELLTETTERDREGFTRAFLRAGATLARLGGRSSAFVQVRDGGIVPSGVGAVPFHVSEWIEGVPLRPLLEQGQRRNRARWTAAQVLAWFEEPLRALSLAHAEGMVHRAIHPANMLVVGGTLRPLGPIKLLGFTEAALRIAAPGAAGAMQDPEPESLAPEVLAGDVARIGPWTDVYGIARVLAELLLGRRVSAGVADLEPLPLELRFVFEQALAPAAETRFRGLDAFRAAWTEAAMAVTNERMPRQTMVVSAQTADAESAGSFQVRDEHDSETDRPQEIESDAPRARVRLAHTQRFESPRGLDPAMPTRRTLKVIPGPAPAQGSGGAWRERPSHSDLEWRGSPRSRSWILLLSMAVVVAGLCVLAMLLVSR